MLHPLNCQVFCHTNEKNNEDKNLHNQSGYAPETREWMIWGFQPQKWLYKASHIEDCGSTWQFFNLSFVVKGPVLNKTDSGENSWEKGQVGTNMALWVRENDSGRIFVMHNVVHRAGILVMNKVVHRAASLLCTMWSLLTLALLCLPASDFNMYYGIQVWKLGIPIFNFQIYP